jgi:hypothetical protein
MMEKPQPEQNNQEYDLKNSTKKIGQLYPVLKAADGEILDGCHRIESDPSWKALVLENINTPEEKIIARLVANFHRRVVTPEEKAEWINGLAEIYRNDGLKVEGTSERAPQARPNEIVKKISKVTGLSKRTVRHYLKPEFLQGACRILDPEKHYVKDPETVIINTIGAHRRQYARELVQRFKEKIEKELLESPIFRKKILEKLEPLLKPRSSPCHYHTRKELAEKKLAQLANDRKEGFEQLPDLYETFIQECPNCLCSKCPHADTCIERVRPESIKVENLW